MPRQKEGISKRKRTEQENKAWAYWLKNPIEFVKDNFGITPEDYQGEILTGIFGDKDRTAIKATHGCGKGQSVNDVVLTPDGWQEIGKLRIGDLVAAPDGTFSRVTGIFHRGRLPMFRVSLNDGTFLRVDGDHLWWTDTRPQRAGKAKPGNHVKTTMEIAATVTFANGRARGLNHRIPRLLPVQHPERQLPCDPYLMGFWIGDGCANGSLNYPELPEAKRKLLNGVKHMRRAWLGDLHGKRSYERYIPREFLFASIEQRIDLLAGLLDTDGEGGGRIVYSTTSPMLRDDVACLVRSLGGVARVDDGRITHYTHNGEKRDGRMSWRVSISLPFDPFRHVDKKIRLTDHQNRTRCLDRFITSVEPDGSDEVVCISVSHPTQLYVAKDHIVTHNTSLHAWAGWLFLNGYPESRVVATAPTQAQLHDALWPEYAKWHARMPEELRNQWRISGGHIRHKLADHHWFAVARTSNKSANLQGFHGTHLMMQIDEASAVPQDVFEVIEGALSEAGEEGKVSKLILAGNPNFTTGELYDAFHKNSNLYTLFTITGDRQTMDYLGVKQGEFLKNHGRVYYSDRVKQKYRDVMAKKYGLDSSVYDVRVRGLFPRQDDGAVIPLEWAQRAAGKQLPTFDAIKDQVTLVLDVSRFGGDETVLGVFRSGLPVKIHTWAKTSTERCIQIVIDAKKTYENMGLSILDVIVDEPGIGGGVIDGLRAAGIAVTPYNGGGSLKQGLDPDDDIRMFGNIRSRDWWHLRRLLEQEKIPLPDDEELINQLASVRYDFNSKEKMMVESKADMRKRLGDDASPDRADVIVMGCAPRYSYRETNVAITNLDIIEGPDRPQAELDLW